MTFREFLGVLGARWRIIAVSLLAVVAATAVQTMLTPAVYTSSSKIYLRATTPASATNNNQVATYAVSAGDLGTYLEVLTSPSVMDPLRTRLGLPAGFPLSVSGDVSQTSNMMTITATGGDPQLVARVATEAGPVLADVAKKFSPLLASNGQAVEADTIVPASVPADPTSPNAKRNLMLGALLGLALGVGLALLRHTLDTKVRTEEDIKALSKRPILGDIPMVKSVKNGLLSLESDPHGRHAESIRRLRTNILFVDVTTGGHSFVVTSSVPGEGKTTTTINLALAMADAGSKVLLIDGDLRNPSVASTMGLDGSFGLTTLLLGQADTDDVIQRWRETTLHVLPAGPVPPNPSELLGSEPMEVLFGKLSHDYDFILVDSPPVVPVIDAVLINKLTHGLIMVVGAERTKKRDLASAVQSLETVDAPVAGFALNMVSAGSSTAHRYGYYGYNRDADVKPSRRAKRSQAKHHS
ncbi:capsular biosynthesis protein [Terrabacter sp. Root85]|uniref:polysaccharide biosynthesis tyrosine autokinase n=1 Tax=Terrabacter sp. Root85 TaxID=1736603 RepID=UPI0006F772C5|nr:polysaccharide biosynthesis tyrosine autokinase [Terrabacter sp. Root85]KRC87492.1 capsular biosynthesis protein [Terrabacter sp. Root85]